MGGPSGGPSLEGIFNGIEADIDLFSYFAIRISAILFMIILRRVDIDDDLLRKDVARVAMGVGLVA